MRLVVTGGAGFIGSNFVRYMLRRHDDVEIVNLDKLTYAGNLENLRDVEDDPRYRFVHGDICDAAVVARDAARRRRRRQLRRRDPRRPLHQRPAGLHPHRRPRHAHPARGGARRWRSPRFLQVSHRRGVRQHRDRARSPRSPTSTPSSPYSASKAGADLLVLAYHRTFGTPVLITRSSNNYGPYQYPEKIVPLFITNAIDDQPLPVYGDGLNVRDWLYVDDNCAGIDLVLREGVPGRGLQHRRRQRGRRTSPSRTASSSCSARAPS